MATATFRIYTHSLVRGPSLTVRRANGVTGTAAGCIHLLGEGGYRLVLYFLDDAGLAALGATGEFDADRLSGALFLPLSEWSDYVTLVRQAPLLCAWLDSDRPQDNALQTLDTFDPDAVVRA